MTSMAKRADRMRAGIWRNVARMMFCVGDALIWVGGECARRANRTERR